MSRSNLLAFALMSFLVLAWSPAARSAGDPVRGNTLYHTTYSCTDCHDPNPSGPYATAGSTVAGILNAISNESPMTFRYGFTLAQNQTDLADLAAYLASVAPGSPPPPPTGTTAVEYYYADWNFYFETSFPAEIAALDGGAFGGAWKRTGQTFNVWTQASDNPAAVPTCRFFSTAFAPKSSHFYTPFANECDVVKTESAWQYEAIAFYIALADTNGMCGAGTIPLYRAYDNGMGGAPNHRYTTSLAILNQMIAAGWLFEGNGNTMVFACVPQ
jgi:cytochrome c553